MVVRRARAAGAKVLIVDDDRGVRTSIADILVDEGYDVEVAANGALALELLRDGLRPSIVLLDVSMPVLNGFEFLERSRGEPGLDAVPVIVMTAGHEKIPDVAHVLRKPMTIETLLEAMRACQAPVV
jgi:CheY-like chemotaxis protein